VNKEAICKKQNPEEKVRKKMSANFVRKKISLNLKNLKDI